MIWTPDEEWEKKEQKYLKKRQIEYEKLKTEREIKNCAKLIDKKLNEGKEYFLEVLKKKNTINSNDVENYLKKSGGRLDTIQFPAGKIGDLQSQPLKDFGVHFDNDKLEHFSFRLKTKHLPKKFSLKISGNDYYSGFSAGYFSGKNKFYVTTGPDIHIFPHGSLTKKLTDKLAKISKYKDDPIPF